MPAGETLAGFGATGATLAIHLAIHALARVVAELTPLYGGGLPGGGRGAGELAGGAHRARHARRRSRRLVAADPIDRTAIIFVGPGLAAEGFRESALYDAGYQRRFRGRAGVSARLEAAVGRLAPELPEFAAGPGLAGRRRAGRASAA